MGMLTAAWWWPGVELGFRPVCYLQDEGKGTAKSQYRTKVGACLGPRYRHEDHQVLGDVFRVVGMVDECGERQVRWGRARRCTGRDV